MYVAVDQKKVSDLASALLNRSVPCVWAQILLKCSLANSGPTGSESIGGNDGNKLLVLHRHLQGTGCLPRGCDLRILTARSLNRFQ
jgi:hypothetical protein